MILVDSLKASSVGRRTASCVISDHMIPLPLLLWECYDLCTNPLPQSVLSTRAISFLFLPIVTMKKK